MDSICSSWSEPYNSIIIIVYNNNSRLYNHLYGADLVAFLSRVSSTHSLYGGVVYLRELMT